MANERSHSSSSSSLGIAGTGIGLAALIGLFTLGPIDSARTAYNAIVGDVPLVRGRAVEYCRKNIHRENPSYNERQVEEVLARDLNYSLRKDEIIDPQAVRMMELWDATETHADGGYARWVWPSLPK
ncbi:MAG: hypothetical protein WCI72_01595 [archaeon]